VAALEKRGRFDTMRLLGTATRQLARAAGGRLGMVTRLPRLKVPGRLVIAPQDIRTSDPTIATEIYAGHLSFAGKTIDTQGQPLFDIETEHAGFLEELHGFGWLRHLRAADNPLSTVNGRALTADWIVRHARSPRGVAGRSAVTARRVLSWISQSPLLLDGADVTFHRRLTRALALDARRLERAVARSGSGIDRLRALVALTFHGVSCSDLDRELKVWARQLCAELDSQILPDGGHVSRDTGLIVELLLDLLPLRLAFPGRRLQTPEPLMAAIDRMIPMLRMMRHTDGSLALFNGTGATPADSVAAVLAHDDMMAQPTENAPHTGYQRLAAGPSVLLMDTGPPPQPPRADRAHLAPLAIEFSSGASRLIVGCGTPLWPRPGIARLARLTAAHSTLVIADESAGALARVPLSPGLGEQVIRGARHVTAERSAEGGAVAVTASHDGYRAAYGLLHRRQVTLSGDGLTLAGLDELVAASVGRASAEHPYALRFHLHPAAGAVARQDRRAAFITLPNREIWQFEAGGSLLAIEDSIFFATSGAPRATSQIVVYGHASREPAVAWSLRRTTAAR
jgi:uncharacterized heparinase superfamily protein